MDLLYLLLLGFSTLLIQLVGFPIILALFGKQRAQPEIWGWGRLVGWLVIGLGIWFLAHIGLPLNTTAGFWLSSILIAGCIYAWSNWQTVTVVRRFLRAHPRQVLIQEGIFLAGFLFLGLVRTYHPEVLDLEKFMDAGLINGYLRSPTLPMEDMWLAGETVNYYTFGHFLGSLMLRFWSLPIETGYNILLAWVMGLVLLQSAVLTQTFLRPFLALKKTSVLPLLISGGVALLLLGFSGNTHAAWYWLTNHSFAGYWYPDATRFIESTIHEFPAYSFIVSDLHAHVWSMPIVLLTLFVAWQWFETVMQVKLKKWQSLLKEQRLIIESAVLGILLGVLGMTSTWDMLVYGLVVAVLAGLTLALSPRKFFSLSFAAIVAGLSAGMTMSPWLLHFSSISQGIFLVTSRSPLWQLAVLWLGHGVLTALVLAIAVLWLRWQKQLHAGALFLAALSISAFLLILLPELIYFKDIYPGHPRANTMFKLTFQSFILMSLLVAWLAGFVSQTSFLKKGWRILIWLLLGGFLVAVLAYPWFGYRDYYGGFRLRSGFNGLKWLQQKSPQEHEAIVWLRANVSGRPVVLEAVGESYTEHARVSTFSGLPTVLGWRVHEWLWRGGFEIPGARTEQVKIIYEQPLSFEATSLLNTYAVQYIFVGSKERETYDLDRRSLLKLGEVIFQRDTVFILKRTP